MMARGKPRSGNQRDNYRPGGDDSDWTHESRRGRSASRERRRSPPLLPSRRRQDGWRSPERDRDRAYQSRRDRSSDSRRSGRPFSRSPHHSTRHEKERLRSPDLLDSRYPRHSAINRSSSPSSKRRRSISPYPDSRRTTKKSKRPHSPLPRSPSPTMRGRHRDPSMSPRRRSPRRSRQPDHKSAVRDHERSRSPVRHVRNRSGSRSSRRDGRRHSPSRYSPSYRKLSPRTNPLRNSPIRHSPDLRRRNSPPGKKRRDPPGASPRNKSAGSPKRRRLSRSPVGSRHDKQPLTPTSYGSEIQKQERPFADRKHERDLITGTAKHDSTPRRGIKLSPIRGRDVIGKVVDEKAYIKERSESLKNLSQPMLNYDGRDDNADRNRLHKEAESGRPTGYESSQPVTDLERRPSSDATTGATPNNDRRFAGGANGSKSGGKPNGRTPEEYQSRSGYPNQHTPASNSNQTQSSYYQQSSYKHSNTPNPAGGFRPNQFTPVAESVQLTTTQTSFQIQTPTQPSSSRGKGINIFLGSRAGTRGRPDVQNRHAPISLASAPVRPPPQPVEAEARHSEAKISRPTNVMAQGETQEDQRRKSTHISASHETLQVRSEIKVPSPVNERKQSRESSTSQMGPPQSRQNGSAQTQSRRSQVHSGSDSKGFRPFALNSNNNKAKIHTKPEPPSKTRTLVSRDRISDVPNMGAQATSQVVEALKAISRKEQSPAKPVSAHIQKILFSNPSDPFRCSIFERLSMVGEGTYGKVYKARNKDNGQLVALKRIRMENERDGFPITAAREMKLLQSLQHENIVCLLETMTERIPGHRTKDFYMVFEYMDHDLTGILNHPTFQLEPGHIKNLAHQFFQGLEYLHHRGVLHRDIKASNILIDGKGVLKIADFGLARFYQKRLTGKKPCDYTNRIITLWYRPPEILLGDTAYGPAVDIWSAGCVFIELFTRTAIFPGNSEINQLDSIYSVLGSPTPDVWPNLRDMPWYMMLKPRRPKPSTFDEKYADKLSPAAMDLARAIFAFDPEKRPTATSCLQHPYFVEEEPKAESCGLVHLQGEWHEFEAKTRKRKERQERQVARDKEASANASK